MAAAGPSAASGTLATCIVRRPIRAGRTGVSLEPGGTHVLVADVFGAAIYRVDLASEATEKLYQHRYGINSAARDSRGAIWFSQSAHNTPEEGEPRLWAAVDVLRPEGALYRLTVREGQPAGEATLPSPDGAFRFPVPR